jgi:hypothetical protein
MSGIAKEKCIKRMQQLTRRKCEQFVHTFANSMPRVRTHWRMGAATDQERRAILEALEKTMDATGSR